MHRDVKVVVKVVAKVGVPAELAAAAAVEAQQPAVFALAMRR